MNTYLTEPMVFGVNEDVNDINRVAHCIGVPPKEVKSVLLHKKSIDARHGGVRFVCSYVVTTASAFVKNAKPYLPPHNVLDEVPESCDKRVVVVGSGPAGLFAALYLSKAGAKVTVIERGSDVPQRKKAVERYFSGGAFSEQTNVQFGLGGAGTFSDGKLTTGISSPYLFTVFDTFCRCGAPKEIMYQANAHIGTDYLTDVVAGLRDAIASCGGEFLFDTKAEDIVAKEGKIVGVVANGREMPCDAVVFAVGNGARDTFRMLYERGAAMESKPFAVGLRVEHDRMFISQAQYGQLAATHRDLASASYKMAANFEGGRSCYTFCMCPGGVVVAANSEKDTVVVNGMSDFARSAANSNSAVVVNVTKEDVGEGVFAGMAFQERLEKLCFTAAGGNYAAPCQNVADFLAGKPTERFDLAPSYPRGVKSVDLRRLLPSFLTESIAKGLVEFGKKIKGFDTCGILTAIETRTSSPVRILRDRETLQSLSLAGLYPCGEGAGYAGGIVSAAVDGLKTALKITSKDV